MTTINKIPNSLKDEKSPYLLQHVYNPVNWYPWTDEAFEKAKKEDKPIFLSIGYSTCHWCHVMAHESFEDEEVAKVLNQDYVCIKVDREERPDVDAVYMNVAQRMNGNGGWPLTIIMTPEQKPFFSATYIPKNARYGMKGLIEILHIVSSKWKNNKEELVLSGDKITKAVINLEKTNSSKNQITKKIMREAFDSFEKIFDAQYGGFGSSPKFPQPSNLLFLLYYYMYEKNEYALFMVNKTLDSMYKGGIYDHVGYGFSRYATDRKWLVPHFEKMLYDNAQLSMVYTLLYNITGNSTYKDISKNILQYILREMRDERGGFYSAQDADSEGEEGKYYVFTHEEIIRVLGEEDGEYFNNYYDITNKGNFEGKNIPNLLKNENFVVNDEKINSLNQKVYEYRLKRTKLHKDDKILTSWNAIMIVAFARGYKAFGDEKYKEVAIDAVNFIKEYLFDDEGNLGVRYREENLMQGATLTDYAMFVFSLIEMYEATLDLEYLKRAVELNEKMIDLFLDEEGGFFMTSSKGDKLIYNPKETYDGVIPSGNSVAAYNLIKLSRLTGNYNIDKVAQKHFEFMATYINDYPIMYTFSLISLFYELYGSKDLVCIYKEEDKDYVKQIIANNHSINTSILAVNLKEIEEAKEFIESIKNYKTVEGKTTFYICENKNCSLPITNRVELEKAMN